MIKSTAKVPTALPTIPTGVMTLIVLGIGSLDLDGPIILVDAVLGY